MSMLSLSFMYLYITLLEEVCGVSCRVEIGTAGEDQVKRRQCQDSWFLKVVMVTGVALL